MWEELTELLLGLVGAGIALGALYYFIAGVQRDHAEEDDEDDEPPAPQHEALTLDDGESRSAHAHRFAEGSVASVAELYICAEAGAAMQRASAVEAVVGKGLTGDRYSINRGHWSESDECEVTLIAQEDLDVAMRETGISLEDGRHRRNIVTSDTDLASLLGQRFRVGGAYFSAARPRPPCLYLQMLTEPGLARALVGRGGIGVHCFRSGPIREGDPVVVLDLSLRTLVKRRWRALTAGKGHADQKDRPT